MAEINYNMSPVETEWVYYTGLNVNATKASRTAISGVIAPGYIVCRDHYDHDGYGPNFTKPETAILGANMVRWGIVLSVPKGSESGGKILITSNADKVLARTKANMTRLQTPLGPANGSWALAAVTLSIANGTANRNNLILGCATALETHDSSGAAEPGTMKLVTIGPLGVYAP